MTIERLVKDVRTQMWRKWKIPSEDKRKGYERVKVQERDWARDTFPKENIVKKEWSQQK